jgi:hypothetical protein
MHNILAIISATLDMKKITIILALLLSTGISAQTDSLRKEKINQFNLGLSFLGHGEVRGGGLPKPSDPETVVEDHANFLMSRLRLTLGYQRKWLEAKAVLQNSAIWGAKNNMDIRMYEAWVKMTAPCGLFAQGGRIALAYDDERIIGPNDFATAAASHDVLRVGYEGHGHKVHAILAFNQNGSNIYTGTYYDDGAEYYKSMQTLWYHYDLPRFPLGVSALFMNYGFQAGFPADQYNPERTEYQQMFGGYVNYHPKYLQLELSYYRQTGKEVWEKMSNDIRAWMAGVKLTVKPSDRYGFQLGYDYLSGDDYVSVPHPGTLGSTGGLQLVQHQVERGFAPMYGSRTKFYGMLDYFYESAYINGFTPGLQNAFFGVFGKPVLKLNIGLYYHYLAVATDLRGLGRTLGHNIDLLAKYEFTKDISLSIGYTQMLGTETMNRLKQGTGSKHAEWAWFSLSVSPTIFSTKW